MVSELNIDQLVHQALSSLLEHKSEHGWISVVVDPMLSQDLSADPEIHTLLSAGLVERHVWPITHVDFPLDERPYLLSMQAPDVAQRVLPTSLRRAWAERSCSTPQASSTRSIAGWLVHDTAPHKVTEALAKACRIQKPDGSPWVLRYWDPRVTGHLVRAWPEWHRCFAPLLASWYQWHFDGSWQPWARVSLQSNLKAPQPPLRAEVTIWQSLQRIAIVNHLLAWLPNWQIAVEDDTAQHIDEYLLQAQSHGYKETQDQASYVTACLQCHPSFHDTARFQQARCASPETSSALSTVLLTLSDDDWLLIAQQARALTADRLSQISSRKKP